MSISGKVFILLALFAIMETGTFVSERTDILLGSLRSEVASLEAERDELIRKSADLESEYRESLVYIVQSLYEKDSLRNTGGRHEDLGYDNALLYEAIVNATTDYNALLRDVKYFFDNRTEYLENIPSIWPVAFSTLNRITSPFGARISPFTGMIQHHKGIDIAGELKQGVLVTASGVVVEVWIYHPIYGKMVVVDHGNGFETLYAHMSRTYVREGQQVQRGQVIGIMGNTGLSMGNHLHYEVHLDGKLMNPLDYLSSNSILIMNRQQVTGEEIIPMNPAGIP